MNRDKRTAAGHKRYVRQVGDHALLLAACQCPPTSGPHASSKPGGVCELCQGAVQVPDEKRDAVPPG